MPLNCPFLTINSLKVDIELSFNTASGTIIAARDFTLSRFNALSICKIETALPFFIIGKYN